jgi:hypothetical protein
MLHCPVYNSVYHTVRWMSAASARWRRTKQHSAAPWVHADSSVVTAESLMGLQLGDLLGAHFRLTAIAIESIS